MAANVRKFLTITGSIVLLTAAVLFVTEVGARIWLNQFASSEAFRRFASVDQFRVREAAQDHTVLRFSPHRYIGYIPSPNYRAPEGTVRHNSLGFRSPEFPMEKPEGEFRILCLGASTTYGLYPKDLEGIAELMALLRESDGKPTPELNEAIREATGMGNLEDLAYNMHYPGVLEGILQERGHDSVRVINGGCFGYTTWDTLANFQFRGLDIEPDLVITYHGYNDIHSRLVWPPERYRGDASGAIGHSPGLERNVAWYERLTSFRIPRIALGYADPPISLHATFSRPQPTFKMWTYHNQLIEGRYPEGFFRNHPVSEILDTNPPIYFRRNMENIVAIARKQNVTPVLLTFVYFDGDDRSPFNTPEYEDAVAEHNDVIREIARAGDAPLLDLAAGFPGEAEHFSDVVHMTQSGGREMATRIADFLEAQGLLPDRE